MVLGGIHRSSDGSEFESRLLRLIDDFSSRRLLVVGDLVADEFIYGRLSRVSREAPVLILEYDKTTILPGGAGNAASNVATVGATAELVGVLGREDVDKRVLRAFPKGIKRSGIVRIKNYRTPVKTRILAGGLHSARQQIVRIDREGLAQDEDEIRSLVERSTLNVLPECDAVLVSDYGSGLITPSLVTSIRRSLSKRGRRRRVPILVDSRHQLLRYRGLTACTPNESEAEAVLGRQIGDDSRKLERAGREILKRTRSEGVVLTRGSRGMSVFVPGQRTAHLPIYGTDEIADVTGAGDTVIAVTALALASGASLYEAAQLATYAGGLVVMKRGTATVSGDELRRAVLAAGSE